MLTTKTRKCIPWWKFGEIWRICSDVPSFWKRVGINLFWLLGQETPTRMDFFKWVHNLITTNYLGMDSETVTITTTISNRSYFWTIGLCCFPHPSPPYLLGHLCMYAQSFSHVRLFCNPMDCSLPGSSVQGICQARTLERVAISSSRESSWSRNQISSLALVGRFFTTGEAQADYVSRSPKTALFWWDPANRRL